MKEEKVPQFLTDAMDRLDQAIEDNRNLFQNNLQQVRMALSSTVQIGDSLRHQNEINALFVNMIRDLERLQIFLSEKAYVRGQIDLAAKQDGNTNGLDALDASSVKLLLNMANSPLYDPDRSRPCIVQVVSVLNYGDAVGNDVLAIKRALEEEGYLTAVYTAHIHKKIKEKNVFDIQYLPQLKEDDIIIYHFAAEDPFAEKIKNLTCKVVLRYHNVTPPVYFRDFDKQAEKATRNGIAQVKSMAAYVDYGMAVSQFNRRDLFCMGYQCPIKTVPVLIPFSDYRKEPAQEVLKQYKDGRTNIIFVGRGVPNKKIEDVIVCFLAYKKIYNARARLFLVGNYDKKGRYFAHLKKFFKGGGNSDIIFPGHISFAQMLAYYKIANVFLCMSEHEGFCVPLTEAMFFEIPVIAYNRAAVSETLGKAGILMDDKEPDKVAFQIHKVVTEPKVREELIEYGKERLKDFQYETVKGQIMNFLKIVTEESASYTNVGDSR